MEEAASLAEETEALREEHRRMQSLIRITKKLFRTRTRKARPGPKTGLPAVARTVSTIFNYLDLTPRLG